MAIIEVSICSSSSSNTSWVGARQNQHNDICALQRLRSVWASTQSDQLLRCALNGSKVSPCEQRKLWEDWGDAQADLSLRLAHRSFWCCFFFVRRLTCYAFSVVKQYPGTCKQISSGCYGQLGHPPSRISFFAVRSTDPRSLHANSENYEKTGGMPKRIWVFAWRTGHFDVVFFSCGGSPVMHFLS